MIRIKTSRHYFIAQCILLVTALGFVISTFSVREVKLNKFDPAGIVGVLLDYSRDKHVKILSLRGLLDEIDTEMPTFKFGHLSENDQKFVQHGEKFSKILDKRMKSYHTAALTLCMAFETGQNGGRMGARKKTPRKFRDYRV